MRRYLSALAVTLVLSAPLAAGFAADLPAGHPPLDQMPKPTPASHSGEVLETIPAAGYVYLHVKGADGDEWLAAPAAELKVGQKIRWNDGMVMKNFASKTLKRTFETIRFVEVVQPAE